jgi:hypothetical protein
VVEASTEEDFLNLVEGGTNAHCESTSSLISVSCTVWAAAGFMDILLRWKMKLEVVHGNEKAIQPGVQA